MVIYPGKSILAIDKGQTGPGCWEDCEYESRARCGTSLDAGNKGTKGYDGRARDRTDTHIDNLRE